MDLFKIIISSADFFPGLYRISSSWKQSIEQDRYLKLLGFLEIVFHAEKGRRWSRDQWFSAHDHIFKLAYGKNSRNDQREEDDIKVLLKNRGFDWYKKAKSFSLALIDSETSVHEIELNKTYYMMGSLLRFESERFLISYDDFSGQSVLSLNVGFAEALKYIHDTFSSDSIRNLFLQSEIVAHLNFIEDSEGELTYDGSKVDRLLERFPANCPVFASVNYDPQLPIRFAKLIGVGNVLA